MEWHVFLHSINYNAHTVGSQPWLLGEVRVTRKAELHVVGIGDPQHMAICACIMRLTLCRSCASHVQAAISKQC